MIPLSTETPALAEFLDPLLVTPLGAFIAMSSNVFNTVLSQIGNGATGSGTVDPALLAIATDLALVGCNSMRSYLAIGALNGDGDELEIFELDVDGLDLTPSLVDDTQYEVMRIASAFEATYCVLKNAFPSPPNYPDYSDIYGESNASSIAGGSAPSPLAGQNVWGLVVPLPTPTVSVAIQSRANIAALKNIDPVLAPPTLATLAAQLANIASGVAIA